MEKKSVKVGVLSFELHISDDPEVMPTLEIEDTASMLYVDLDIEEAMDLRDLLESYIVISRDS